MIKFTKDKSLISFLCSILFFTFVLGILVGHYKFFPFNIIASGWQGILDWREHFKHNLEIMPQKHLGKPRKDYQPSFFRKEGAWPGVTLLTSFVRNETISVPGLQLLDMDGNIIHEWAVSAGEVFPEADRRDWDVLITGAVLLKNGDVIFNFDGIGIVKLDWCSKVIWKFPIYTNHNIFIDDNDNIWTSGKNHATKRLFKTQSPEILEIDQPDTVLQLSPQGELLKEIDVFDAILNSDMKGILFANGQQDLYYKSVTDSLDFTHINDVEVLGKAIADKYPLFQAGDIMVSLRNLNLLMVLDSKTNLIKWMLVGPFLRQHDPDFDGHGRISVFDNMGGGPKGDIGLASRIISIDPVTKAITVSYRADPPEDFYTPERGSHQNLPNGNILITETFEGRIFEVNPAGETVWQYLAKWDDEWTIQSYQAERYDDVYSSNRKERCE